MVAVCTRTIGCYKITTVFSHAQTVVLCVSCSTVLAQPTGGRARLTEGEYIHVHVNVPSGTNGDCVQSTDSLNIWVNPYN